VPPVAGGEHLGEQRDDRPQSSGTHSGRYLVPREHPDVSAAGGVHDHIQAMAHLLIGIRPQQGTRVAEQAPDPFGLRHRGIGPFVAKGPLRGWVIDPVIPRRGFQVAGRLVEQVLKPSLERVIRKVQTGSFNSG
jgi:hypothetical protein